jgi:hypothetical protein
MSIDTPRNEPDAPRRPLATALTILAGALGVLIRLIPHPANFVPVGAMGIFGGAKQRGRRAYLLPIGVMVVSDLGLWAYAGCDPKYLFHLSRIYVYGSFLIYVAIGRLLRGRESPLKICCACLAGSLQFFVITNFCVWLLQPLESMEGVPAANIYSRDLSGLLACFAAATPFYVAESSPSLHVIFMGDMHYSIFGLVIGDLFFTFGLFVLYGALAPKAAPAGQAAVPQQGAAP